MAEVEYQVGLLERESVGTGIVPLLEYFVADAVDDYRGMVAVAAYEVGEVALVPFVEIARVVVRGFLLAPHVEGLVHDEYAHAVTQVEHFGSGWIVGGTIGVGTHLLEYFELTFECAGVDSRAERAEVVVHAHAVDFHRAAVE